MNAHGQHHLLRTTNLPADTAAPRPTTSRPGLQKLAPLAATAGRSNQRRGPPRTNSHRLNPTPTISSMEHQTEPDRSKSSCTSGHSQTAPPPDPPPQSQSTPCNDEEKTRGQKLHAQNAVSAPASTQRAANLAGSTDPREPTTSSSPTPPKASSGRGPSSGSIIPRRRRRHHLASAAGNHYSTLYTPQARIRGPPTLPPPQRRPEREGTGRSAVGGRVSRATLPFRLSRTVFGKETGRRELVTFFALN